MTDNLFTTIMAILTSVSDPLFEETDSVYNNEPLLAKRTFSYASEDLTSKETFDAEGLHSYLEQPSKKLRTELSDVLVFNTESLSDQKEMLSKANSKKRRAKNEVENEAKDVFSTDLSVSDLESVKSLEKVVNGNFEQENELDSSTDELWVEISSEPDYEMSQLLENLRKEGVRKQHNSINVDYKAFAADIPKFSLNNILLRKERRVLKPVWNPEDADQDFLNEYSSRLICALNQVLINEEKSLDLLKKFDMDVDKALEQVNKEKLYYSSYLSVNKRQLRKKI